VSAWIPITGAVVYVITIGLGIYLDRKLRLYTKSC